MAAYPPDDHVLRDLRIESWLEAEDHSFGELPVDDAVRDRSGAVAIGALATLVDLACARVAFPSAHPHWIATADLSIVRGEPVAEGVVTAEARLVKAGSKLISIDVDLHGAGTAATSFARIPREASEVDRPPLPIGVRTSMPLLAEPPVRRRSPTAWDCGSSTVGSSSTAPTTSATASARSTAGCSASSWPPPPRRRPGSSPPTSCSATSARRRSGPHAPPPPSCATADHAVCDVGPGRRRRRPAPGRGPTVTATR